MSKHVWLVYLDGMYPKTYLVTVDGEVYDTIRYFRGGKKLSRNQMRDIAAGYKEWLDFENPN